MMEIDYAIMCKALGEPTRLKIFNLLKQSEKCACSLLEEFNVTQPTLSYHMQILNESRLIITRKEGKWSYYSLDCEIVEELTNYLSRKCVENKACKCNKI